MSDDVLDGVPRREPKVTVRRRHRHRWVGYIEVPLDGNKLQLWADRSFDDFHTEDVSYAGPVCSRCGRSWP
jgi:hypothetical protein